MHVGNITIGTNERKTTHDIHGCDIEVTMFGVNSGDRSLLNFSLHSMRTMDIVMSDDTPSGRTIMFSQC